LAAFTPKNNSTTALSDVHECLVCLTDAVILFSGGAVLNKMDNENVAAVLPENCGEYMYVETFHIFLLKNENN
jgi:hypothetical protein